MHSFILFAILIISSPFQLFASNQGGFQEVWEQMHVKKASDLVKSNETIYDPGLRFTAPFPPHNISQIEGEGGKLSYRGDPFETFLNTPYPEVSSVLAGIKFEDRCWPLPLEIVDAAGFLNNHSDPMWGIRFIYSLLAANGVDKSPEAAFGYMPTIFAFLIRKEQGRAYIPPKLDLSYIDNFFYMCTGLKPDLKTEASQHQKRLLNLLLIAHAEHGMNLSTATARVTASGYEPDEKDYFSCIGSALNSLAGPRHGGANLTVIKMFQQIGDVENIPDYLDKVAQKEEMLWGFGHRVYRVEDPRAKLFAVELDKLLEEFSISDPTLSNYLQIAKELKRQALEHSFVKEKNINPNMDYYSGLLIMALGMLNEGENSTFKIPETFLTAFFAWGRLAGWIAHIKEQSGAIIRPRSIAKL